MNLSGQSFGVLLKNSLCSGAFAVISFISFFFTYHYMNPKLDVFMRFFSSDKLHLWVNFNLTEIDTILLTLSFIVFSIILSTVGLLSAIIAKSYHDKTVDFIKGQIVT